MADSTTRQIDIVINIIGNAKEKLTAFSVSLQKVVEPVKNLRKTLSGVSDTYTKYGLAANKAATATKSFSDKMKDLSNSVAAYMKYRFIADTIIGAKEAFTSGTDAIVSYDQALKDLQAITGATTLQTEQMGETIKEVASTTKFSAQEVAEGMRTLGQSGLTASESIQAMQYVSNLATGTLSNMATTVDLVTTALRVFNKDASESQMITDVFANAVNKSKLTIDKLKTAMNYVGPIANSTGISIQEMSASMMTLANSGLRASTIGTGLRRVFAELADPSAKLAAAADAVGVSLTSLDPTSNSLEEVFDSLGLVVQDTGTAFDLFGKRGASAALALTSGTSQYTDLLKTVKKTGTAAAMAETQMQGLAVSLKNLRDKVGNLAIAFGEAGLIDAFKLLIDVGRDLIDVFTAIVDSAFGKFVVQTALVTAGILAVVSSISVLKLAFTALRLGTVVESFAAVSHHIRGLSNTLPAATQATYAFSTATKAATVSLKLLWRSIAPMLVVAAIFVGIATAVKLVSVGIGHFTTSAKESADAATKLADEYGRMAGSATNYEKNLVGLNSSSKEALELNKGLREELMKVAASSSELADEALTAANSINALTGELGNEGIANIRAYREEAEKLANAELAKSFNESFRALKQSTGYMQLFIDSFLLLAGAAKKATIAIGAAFLSLNPNAIIAKMIATGNPFYGLVGHAKDVVSAVKDIFSGKGDFDFSRQLNEGIISFEEYSKKIAEIKAKHANDRNPIEESQLKAYNITAQASITMVNRLAQAGYTAGTHTTEQMLLAAKSMGVLKDATAASEAALSAMIDSGRAADEGVAEKWAKGIKELPISIKEFEDSLVGLDVVFDEQHKKRLAQSLEDEIAFRDAEAEKTNEIKKQYTLRAAAMADAQQAGNKDAELAAAKEYGEKIRVLEQEKRNLRIQFGKDSLRNESINLGKILKKHEAHLTELARVHKGTAILLSEANALALKEYAQDVTKALSGLELELDTDAYLATVKGALQNTESALKQHIYDINLLEAEGTLSHEESEAQKGQTTRDYYASMAIIAKKAYAQLQAEQDQGNTVSATTMDAARKLALTTHDKFLSQKSKDVLKYQKEYLKAEKAVIKELSKLNKEEQDNVNKVTKLKGDARADQTKVDTTYAKDRKKIEKDLAKEIGQIEHDLNERLKGYTKERLQLDKDAAAEKLSLQDTLADKLAALNQRGMTDAQKESDNRQRADSKLREGIQAINDAKKKGDQEALDRGKGLIEQAGSLYESLEDTSAAKSGIQSVFKELEKVTDAQKTLSKKVVDENEKADRTATEAKIQEAKTVSSAILVNLDTEHKEKLAAIKDTLQIALQAEKVRHDKVVLDITDEVSEYRRLMVRAQEDINKARNTVDGSPGKSTYTGQQLKQEATDANKVAEGYKKAATEAEKATTKVDALAASMHIVRKEGETDVQLHIRAVNKGEVDQVIAQFKKEATHKLEGTPITAKAELETSAIDTQIKKLTQDYLRIFTHKTNSGGRTSLTLLAEDAQEAKDKLAEVAHQLDILGKSSGDQLLQDKVNVLNALEEAGVDTSEAVRILAAELDEVDNRTLVIDPGAGYSVINDLTDEVIGASEKINSNPFVISAELGVSGHDTLKSLQNISGLIESIQDESEKIQIEVDAEEAEADINALVGDTDKEVQINAIVDDAEWDAQINGLVSDTEAELLVSVAVKDADQVGTDAAEAIQEGAEGVEVSVPITTPIVNSPPVPLDTGIENIKTKLESINVVEIEVPANVDTAQLEALEVSIAEWDSTVEIKVVTIDESGNLEKTKTLYDTLVDKLITLTLGVSGISKWQAALNIYNSLKSKTITITTVHKDVSKKAAGGVAGHYEDGGNVFNRLANPFISRGGGQEDDVPAMLMKGEFVLKKSAVEKYGKKFLYAMNMGMVNFGDSVSAFAGGGMVQNLGGIANNFSFPAHFENGGVVGAIQSKAFLLGRTAQLAMNPTAPFTEKGVTYNVNAPSFHNHLQGKVNNIKSGRGKHHALGLINTFAHIVPQLSSGGNISELMSQYTDEKALMEDMYEEDIRFAEENGNEQEVFLLEMEQLQLQEIADALAITLQEIKADYEQEMLDATQDLEDDVAAYTEDKDDAANDYRDALSDLNRERADIERKYIKEQRTLERDLAKAEKTLSVAQKAYSTIGSSSTTVTSPTVGKRPTRSTTSNVSGSSTKLADDVATARSEVAEVQSDITNTKIEYERELDHVATEEADELFVHTRLTDRADSSIARATAQYTAQSTLRQAATNADISNETVSAASETQRVETTTEHELATSARNTQHDIRKLEMELQLELLKLRKTYTDLIRTETYNEQETARQVYGSDQPIAIESKHWLNKGGPVGYPKGKKKWEDSIPAMLTPGEYVINEGTVQHYGPAFMDALNNREVDPDYSTFPTFLNKPRMVTVPTTIDGVTYHVNAPSFHTNLAERTHQITSSSGKQHANKLVTLFSDAVPHLAAGGDIGDVEQQLTFEISSADQEYAEKIQYAREQGDDDIAFILTQEQIQLDMIAEELLYTLGTLQEERQVALDDAKYEHDQDLLENEQDYADAVRDTSMDALDAKGDLQDALLDAKRDIDDAKADAADAKSVYLSEVDEYNTQKTAAEAAVTTGFANVASKKQELHRKVDSWVDSKVRTSSSYVDPYSVYNYSSEPSWGSIEGILRRGSYGSASNVSTWSSNTSSAWSGELSRLKSEWGSLIDEESSIRTSKDTVGEAPQELDYSRWTTAESRALEAQVNARSRYTSLVGMYAREKLAAANQKTTADAMTEVRYNNAIDQAELAYANESGHAVSEATNDARDISSTADHDVSSREREMTNEIKLLEISLAKAIFDLKKQYSTAGTLEAKHWLNKGGSVGFPSGARNGVDSIRAMLTPGEYVISEPAVRRFGLDFFDKLNTMRIPSIGFNAGGVVPGNSISGITDPLPELLGTVNLTAGTTTAPMTTNLQLAKMLIGEFKKMGMAMV